jgi:hypothetical protein
LSPKNLERQSFQKKQKQKKKNGNQNTLGSFHELGLSKSAINKILTLKSDICYFDSFFDYYYDGLSANCGRIQSNHIKIKHYVAKENMLIAYMHGIKSLDFLFHSFFR